MLYTPYICCPTTIVRFIKHIFSQTIEQAEKQRITLNTSDLANGIYLINLMTEKGMITKKLVVSH